jgi:adenine-specific DNA-methyltransferase
MTNRALSPHEVGSFEAKRLAAQVGLDEQLSSRRRNEMGQFATPSLLANDIAKVVSKLWSNDQIRFLEPALGTGAFYSALLHNFSHDKIVSAAGIERDHQHASIARQLWSETGLLVTTADFMQLKHTGEDALPNLILANPPYVRHHHLTSSEKGQFQKMASQVSGGDVSGLSGLYTYFVLAAHKWLADGGLAAWLIPSEFMDVNYGQSLRRYFSRGVSLLRIHRFDPSDVQFADALVSSAVVIFCRRPPSNDHRVVVSYGGSVSNPHFSENVPVSCMQVNSKWSRLFNGGSLRPQVSETNLSLLFTINRGIATGANSFFILSRRELAERGIHEQFVKPILPSARFLESDVIESDDAGFPLIREQLAVIDTDLPMERIKRDCIGLWRYLQEGERNEIHNAYLLTKRSPWYRQEQRLPAPFLCTYMGRKKSDGKTFRFFWNRSAAIAANTYLLLYPVGPLRRAISDNPEIGRRVLSSLNNLEPACFAEQGRVYGGGLFKMEPRELGRVEATTLVEELNLGVATQPRLINA